MHINIGVLGFILTLIIQTAGFACWLGGLGARVKKLEDAEEKTDSFREVIYQKINEVVEKLVRLDEGMKYTKEKVEQIEKIMERK